MLMTGMLCLGLSGCQTVLNATNSSTIGPSDNPQTVGRLDKNDPRARLGAREHPRIVASYGGEFSDPKVERPARAHRWRAHPRVGKPEADLANHDPQFTGGQRICPAGWLSLCHARSAGAGQ